MSVTWRECVPGISSKKTLPANCASISCSLILLTQVREQPGDTYSKSCFSPGQHAHVLLTRIPAWLPGIRALPPVAKSLHWPLQALRSATWYWCGKCLSQAAGQGFLQYTHKNGKRSWDIFFFFFYLFTSIADLSDTDSVGRCASLLKSRVKWNVQIHRFRVRPGKVQINRLRNKLEEGLCLVNLVLAMPFLTLQLLPLLLYLSILISLYSEKDSDYKYRESQSNWKTVGRSVVYT